MLVLSRKLGEKVIIAERIVVTVTETACGKVKLGIDAPADVPILRGELIDLPRESVGVGAASPALNCDGRNLIRRLRKIPR